MYITICEINRQSKFNDDTGCSGLVHWDDPEGWDGEGGEEDLGWGGRSGGFRMGNTCTPMADSYQYISKNHYNIV